MLNKTLLFVSIFTLYIIQYSIISYGEVISPRKNTIKQKRSVENLLTKIFSEEIYKKISKLNIIEKVKPISKGQLLLEQIKQKNRNKIAKMRGFDPKNIRSGSDIVKLQKDDNKNILLKMNSIDLLFKSKFKNKSKKWKNEAKLEIQKLRSKILQDHLNWRKKYSKILLSWKGENKKYKKNVSIYKDGVGNIPVTKKVNTIERKRKIFANIKKEIFFVPSVLDIPIRNQGMRSTCSSFTGIRSIETILFQNQKKTNLSEQYFYWASKPKCRKRKCRKKGSWVGYGLEYSKSTLNKDIPLESDCRYLNKNLASNETQVPLKNKCFGGIVKVKSYSYLENLDQAIKALNNNKVVIASVKLSDNFYNNKGLVFQSDIKNNSKLDSHSKGHSVNIIGYFKLPRILNEGKVCFIISNSWGVGWGYGGYSCLSEKWLINHRKVNPFVVINKLEI